LKAVIKQEHSYSKHFFSDSKSNFYSKQLTFEL
jgi:hypothetical protein